MTRSFVKSIFAVAAASLLLGSPSVMACAACYGTKSDSPLAAGMNAGIFSLLAVVGIVLSGFAGFGVFLVKKAAAVAAEEARNPATEAPKEV